MKKITAVLKSFAVTDGLLRGTALISNLITIAAISILPGFGSAGLLVATSIQMLVSGVLEIPTGYLADKYGHARTLQLSLTLKFFVTASFLAAVIAADLGHLDLVWIFFTAEAVIDSFANAFLSGAYQASYLRWYNKKSDLSVSAPPLFLASAAYGLKVRFLLPLLVLGATFTLHLISREYNWIGSYSVAYVSIAIIFVLRFAVWLKVFLDLKNIDLTGNDAFRPKLKLSAEEIKKFGLNANLIVYAAAVCINLISVFYLSGQIFKLFSTTSLSASLTWMAGITFGALVYFFRTAVSIRILPLIGQQEHPKALNFTFGFLCLISTIASVALFYKLPFAFNLAILLGLNLLTSVSAEACMRLIDSKLNHYVHESFHATWISLANSIGLLVFGITSGFILWLSLQDHAVLILSLLILICAATGWFITISKSNKIPSSDLSAVMSATFRRSVYIIIAILATTDISMFTSTSLRLQKKDETTLANLIVQSVSEPLSQGSIVEAQRRLTSLITDKTIACANLEIWNFKNDFCKSENLSSLHFIERRFPIYIGNKSNGAAGYLNIWFDRSDFISSILSRLIFTSILFLSVLAILIVIFRKLSTTIHAEMQAVLSLLRLSKVDEMHPEIQITEFKTLANRLLEFVKIESDLAQQKATTIIAKQVAHDIRSPLSALNVLAKLNDGLSENHRILLSGAIERINGIANNLLDKKENIFADKLNNISSEILLPILDSIIAEKKIEYLDHKSIEITFTAPETSRQFFSKVNVDDLKRVISNLINNSVEAIEGGGRITITLEAAENTNIIRIVDSGKGIRPAILNNLGKEGATYGKSNSHSGSGLGLHTSFKKVQSWGGKLNIESTEGIGTTVTILLPREDFTP